MRYSNGFTLVEILIVVIILGVLAAIIIPQFADASEDTSKATFVTNLTSFVSSAALFREVNHTYLEDSSSGVCPAGFDAYVNRNNWESGTPIGGVWDAELNSFSITSAIGVHFNNAADQKDDAYMTEVDELFDDGDLATGVFRKLDTDRYYYVIEN